MFLYRHTCVNDKSSYMFLEVRMWGLKKVIILVAMVINFGWYCGKLGLGSSEGQVFYEYASTFHKQQWPLRQVTRPRL